MTFLREYSNMTYHEARQELHLQHDTERHSLPPTSMTGSHSPHKKWQEYGEALCAIAQRYLHGPSGGPGLRYLARRGFSDEMIQRKGYGLIPQDVYDTPSHWFASEGNAGAIHKMFIPAGIVIPYYYGGELWKISIRRKRPMDARDRYYDVPGSSECLYNADTISTDSTTVLYEGAFDATSGEQACPDLVHVATGDTQKCRGARWIVRLCLAQQVLVAYDADEAGDREAAFWTRTLSKAIRWRPWAKDANQMLQEALDMRFWLTMGINSHLVTKDASRVSEAEITALQNTVWALAETRGFPAIGPISGGEQGYLELLCYSSMTHLLQVKSTLEAHSKQADIPF